MTRSGMSDDAPHGQLRLFAGNRDPAEYEAWMTAIRGAEAILFASAQPVAADGGLVAEHREDVAAPRPVCRGARAADGHGDSGRVHGGRDGGPARGGGGRSG